MRIELSRTTSHEFLGDIRKFFGQIFAGRSATRPGLVQPPHTVAHSMPKWQAICTVK